MKIDVIVPTYNRSALLPQALDSALAARIPENVMVQFLVVDNNSHDHTPNVISSYIHANKNRIIYLFEAQQGRHHALNTGIAHSTSDIVAFFDDDERLSPEWLVMITEAFQNPKVDYIAGPVRPIWGAHPPLWLPSEGYNGVLGIVDNGTECRPFNTSGFQAMPTGGNFAIRRSALDRCGPYLPDFMYHEDRYMYHQLIKIEAYGLYLPSLEVFHLIPKKRLKKSYFRHWAYNEGLNLGRMASMTPHEGRSICGAPLWKWRQLAEALASRISWRKKIPDRFKAELDILQFLGFYRGKNLGFIKERYFDRS